MSSNVKMIKNWYDLTKPNKKMMFVQFSSVLLRYIFLLLSPIFAARAITNLYAQEYLMAVTNLSIEIVLIVLSAVSFTVNYHLMSRLINPIYLKLQDQVLEAVLKASPRNFKKISKEKLINIVGNDTYYVSHFADFFSGRIARFIRVIITIVVIFFINVYIGFVAIFINIINYLILNYIHEKKSIVVKKLKESNDHLFTSFAQYIDSKDTIHTLNIKSKIMSNFEACSRGYGKEKHKNNVFQSKIDNTYWAFYKIVIYCISLLMILIVSKGALSLTEYLILVPYLLSAVEIANEAFTILPQLKEANIATNRIRSVLSFTEKKKLTFGENAEDVINGMIHFDKVSYRSNSGDSPEIRNINLYIRENETTLICGKRMSGKRTIFRILNRDIRPTSGNVFLSSENIYEFNNNAYLKNFNYVTSKPFLYSGSILKNLKMVDKSQYHIYHVCVTLGLHSIINKLPQKYKSDVSLLTTSQKYLLSVARALLTTCQVLAFYEFPSNITETEKSTIIKSLKRLNGTCTMIIFSANEEWAAVSNKIISIDGGKITNITFNDMKDNEE